MTTILPVEYFTADVGDDINDDTVYRYAYPKAVEAAMEAVHRTLCDAVVMCRGEVLAVVKYDVHNYLNGGHVHELPRYPHA